jgi:hypothetical protein
MGVSWRSPASPDPVRRKRTRHLLDARPEPLHRRPAVTGIATKGRGCSTRRSAVRNCRTQLALRGRLQREEGPVGASRYAPGVDLSRDALGDALATLALPPSDIASVLDRISDQTSGLLIYGSRARGDFVPSSDFDLLRLTTDWSSPTFKVGLASVSSYTSEQLRSASKTLFGTHLRRDGRVLIESERILSAIIENLAPADPLELLVRVRRYATILNQSISESRAHAAGLVRLARYLLRTAVYASAMKRGRTCFSVRELAELYGEPRLATLLASDPRLTDPPTYELLEEIKARLVAITGPLPDHGFDSLESLAIGFWDSDRNLATLAIRAADEDGDSLDYSELPKVLL